MHHLKITIKGVFFPSPKHRKTMVKVLESLQQQQQKEELVVSQNIDFSLFNEFNKIRSIYSYYNLTPIDFNAINEKNKRFMIEKYYTEMRTIFFSNQVDWMSQILPQQGRNFQITQNRSLFNNGNASKSLKLNLNNGEIETEKKTRRYFNVDSIFQTDGGFDLTIDKINVPDRTLFFGNDVVQSYS